MSITTGPDGNLWFTESAGDAIGRITTAGAITEFRSGLSDDSAPASITAGPDGNLWFTDAGVPGRIGRITTAGTITEVATPTIGSAPDGITTGPDGRIWFTETRPRRRRRRARPRRLGRPATATGPTATTAGASGVGQTTATLNGTVDPEGNRTLYHFDWGTTTAYGHEAVANLALAGIGDSAQQESVTLTGLTPGTTYHYRLVATDCGGCQSGTSVGTDMTFVTEAPTTTGPSLPTTPPTTPSTPPAKTPATGTRRDPDPADRPHGRRADRLRHRARPQPEDGHDGTARRRRRDPDRIADRCEPRRAARDDGAERTEALADGNRLGRRASALLQNRHSGLVDLLPRRSAELHAHSERPQQLPVDDGSEQQRQARLPVGARQRRQVLHPRLQQRRDRPRDVVEDGQHVRGHAHLREARPGQRPRSPAPPHSPGPRGAQLPRAHLSRHATRVGALPETDRGDDRGHAGRWPAASCPTRSAP